MDKKNIIKSVGIFAGAFAVLLVAAYFLYPVIEPKEAEKVQEELDAEEQPVESMTFLDTREVSNSSVINRESTLPTPVLDPDIMRHQLDLKERQYVRTIDSLQTVIRDAELVCEDKLEESQQQSLSQEVEHAAKALLSLDEDELGPIVNRLSVSELLKVYRSSSNMQREKLLSVLEPETASQILIMVMS